MSIKQNHFKKYFNKKNFRVEIMNIYNKNLETNFSETKLS